MKTIKNKLKLTSFFALLLFTFSTPALAATGCNSVSTSKQLKTCVQQNQIVQDLQMIINFLSAGVGVVVIGMIITGGIQYSMAGDNAQAINAAKQRITNALIALLAFILMFAFVQWLIPGGVFG